MIFFISTFFSILPILVYLLLIKLADKFNRFTFPLLFTSILWGTLGATLLTFTAGSIIYKISFHENYFQLARYSETVFFSPVIEEFTKGIFLFFIMSNKTCHNKTDGMTYGGAIGFGFSATENFLYYLTYGSNSNDLVFLIIIRTFFVAIMHCTATAALGISIGYSKFKRGIKKLLIPAAGLISSIFIHFAWNSAISFYDAAIWGFISMIIIAAIFIFVYVLSVFNDRKMIIKEIIDEVSKGYLSVEQIAFLNSPVNSYKSRTDKKRQRNLLHTAASLAFNKMYYNHSEGTEKYYYEKEIEKNRFIIKEC